jgi:hypothetical protein
MTKAWLGDWYGRVKKCAQEHGFADATAFAEAHPTTSMLELAKQLAPDIAASQLEKVLIDEADGRSALERCARGLLVRRLREWLPEGWHAEWDDRPLGSHSRRSGAFAMWSGPLGERCDEITWQVWNALIALPIPAGWLPDGPDDPYILKAFAHWQDPD